MAEVSLGGVFLPGPLLWAAIAFVLSSFMSGILGRTAFYGFIWHRALFDFAMFLIIWGGVSEFAYHGAFACSLCVNL